MYRRYYGDDRDTDDRSSYHHFLEELGYDPDPQDGNFSRSFAARLPIDHCKPKFLELETCAFLDRHRAEPFMLYVNFLEPHMPFYGPLDDEHDPNAVTLPANFDDPLEENEPDAYRRKRQSFLDRDEYNGNDLKTESGWRTLTAHYWGLVTQVDRSVGAILEHLERLGLTDDTIVVHTSDHGDMMGSHRMVTKGVMYEEAARVPWLMRVPALGRKQRRLPRAASHIDLVPTLLELMDSKRDIDLPGKSLCPLMQGEPMPEDHVYIEWTVPEPYTPGRNPYGRSRQPHEKPVNHVRTVVAPDGWKLSIHVADRNQLFNLRTDPGETTNVYDVPENQPVIRRLTERITAWQAQVGDELVLEAD
jgi:arylsulfatase A-like enzyme